MEDVATYCRICAAACGIVATVDGETVRKIRGDPEHPVSRGYTCPKGRALAEWHHAAARLDRPTLRRVATSWRDVLDDAAGVIRVVLDREGPDAVGFYLATGLAYDINGWMTAERLVRRIGTRQRYTPVTIDNAPVLRAAELVTGSTALNTVWDPDRSRLLLLFGTNPVVSHGYGTTLADPITRLRDFQGDGGEVWVVDPRRTETAALADRHLQTRPGSDVFVLAWLVRELLDDGADATELEQHCDPADVARLREVVEPFGLDRVVAAADVPSEDLLALAAAIRRAGGIAAMCGTGITMSRDGVVAEWLRWTLLILMGSVDTTRGMVCNPGWLFPLDGVPRPGADAPAPTREAGPGSRPELARWQGQHPCVSLVDEIEHGTLRVLVVGGGNPLTAFPDATRTRAAFERLDALIVLDVVETPLTAIATHVLPVAGQLERADISMLENVAFEGRIQHTEPVVAVGADRRPAWWALGSIARRLGLDVLHGLDPDRCDDETLLGRLAAGSRDGYDTLVAAGPHGLVAPPAPGWVHDRMLPGGRWRIAPEGLVDRLARTAEPESGLVLIPRRRVRWMNSAPDRPSVADRDAAEVRVHPDVAADLGLEDGDAVQVRSAYGSMDAALATDPNVRVGAVSCTHGAWDANVAQLTSATVDVDEETGMPQTSGVPVTISPSPIAAPPVAAPPVARPGGRDEPPA